MHLHEYCYSRNFRYTTCGREDRLRMKKLEIENHI